MMREEIDMKVSVDVGLCTGHGRCANYGPDVYVLDELGFNRTDIDQVSEHLVE